MAAGVSVIRVWTLDESYSLTIAYCIHKIRQRLQNIE